MRIRAKAKAVDRPSSLLWALPLAGLLLTLLLA